jgi:pimeloyl-ACP methyl ester carboxylesterase
VWHDFAQIWQTEGAGEEFVANNLATPPADRAALYESLGMTPDAALSVAEAFDGDMGRCILTLYRSAAQPAMAELGERLGELRARPGLVIAPTEATFTGGEERARWAAEQAGATVEVLEGLGHWWMLQDPEAGANALRRFWTILDDAITPADR